VNSGELLHCSRPAQSKKILFAKFVIFRSIFLSIVFNTGLYFSYNTWFLLKNYKKL
jgi:hypothetical protein